jgi:hypothetical protein
MPKAWEKVTRGAIRKDALNGMQRTGGEAMIKVFATTEDGEGYVQSLGKYESIDEIRIYSAALGPHVLISFFDDYKEDEIEERREGYQMTTFDVDDEDEYEEMRRTGGPDIKTNSSVSANIDDVGRA